MQATTNFSLVDIFPATFNSVAIERVRVEENQVREGNEALSESYAEEFHRHNGILISGKGVYQITKQERSFINAMPAKEFTTDLVEYIAATTPLAYCYDPSEYVMINE